jgi:SAM-dependent methyltransferase
VKRLAEAGYNERLFEGGFRRRFHLARFEWVRGALRRAGAACRSVLELGCFDGRAISYLPGRPVEYLGLDANWEDGLSIARERYRDDAGFEFRQCDTPTDLLRLCSGRRFDTALCLETLEHVPPEFVGGYLRALSDVVTGHLVITVPNEKGPVFLGKYLVKRACGDVAAYKKREILAAALGRMTAVERNEHKGFDYEWVVGETMSCFRVLEVSGYPLRHLPKGLNFGIGILARAAGAMHPHPEAPPAPHRARPCGTTG